PSISGQNSSACTVQDPDATKGVMAPGPRSVAARVTSRLSALESTWLSALCSLVTLVPSGSVMRTGGTGALLPDDSMQVAWNAKRCGHFLGFLAVATFPSALSSKAYTRSPSSPWSRTWAVCTSSPSIDLTG